jgi:hypothetical protein
MSLRLDGKKVAQEIEAKLSLRVEALVKAWETSH